MMKDCEYCGNKYDPDCQDEDFYKSDDYCSMRCEIQDEAYLKAEAADYARYEEMAFGPKDEI
jgi:hypothetical protein